MFLSPMRHLGHHRGSHSFTRTVGSARFLLRYCRKVGNLPHKRTDGDALWQVRGPAGWPTWSHIGALIFYKVVGIPVLDVLLGRSCSRFWATRNGREHYERLPEPLNRAGRYPATGANERRLRVESPQSSVSCATGAFGSVLPLGHRARFRIRACRPYRAQSNGYNERFHRTLLEEHLRIKGRTT